MPPCQCQARHLLVACFKTIVHAQLCCATDRSRLLIGADVAVPGGELANRDVHDLQGIDRIHGCGCAFVFICLDRLCPVCRLPHCPWAGNKSLQHFSPAGTREKVKFAGPQDLLAEIDAARLPAAWGGTRPATDKFVTDKNGELLE